MAIAFVQGNTNFDASVSNTLTAAYTSDVTAGNLLIVATAYPMNTPYTATITDSMGNSYSTAVGPTDSTALFFRNYIHYTVATSTGPNTVTFTTSGAIDFRRLLIHEYSGVDTLDATAANTGPSGAPNSGSASTNYANELIFGWGISNNGLTTPGSGFTLRQTSASESSEDKIVSSTGSYSAVYPADGSAWICQMATFYSSAVNLTAAPWLRF